MMTQTWCYEPIPELNRPVAERLKDFPRQPEMWVHVLRLLARVAMRAWLKLYHRLEVTGLENLPVGSSYVMVANHASHLDAPCLLAATPLAGIHRVFPAAAADYFFSSPPRTWFSAIFVNALPFDRLVDGERSLAMCRELLARPGHVLILFPEGTRSATCEVGRFRSGIGRLVAGTEIPVVPCYLEGCAGAWPKGRRFPSPRKLRIRVGAPSCYTEAGSSRDAVQAICRDLREAVVRMAGESSGNDPGLVTLGWSHRLGRRLR